MSDEKRNRLLAAITLNVILLIAILAGVCIYQLVEIVTLKNLESNLQDKVSYYKTQQNINEKTLEYYKSTQGLLDKAYEYGFVTGN